MTPTEQFAAFIQQNPAEAKMVMGTLRELVEKHPVESTDDLLAMVEQGSADLAADQARLARIKTGLALAFEVAISVVMKRVGV